MTNTQGDHDSSPNLFQPVLQRQSSERQEKSAESKVERYEADGARQAEHRASPAPGQEAVSAQHPYEHAVAWQPAYRKGSAEDLAHQQAAAMQEMAQQTQEHVRRRSMYQQSQQEAQNERFQQQTGDPQPPYRHQGAQQTAQQQAGASQAPGQQAVASQAPYQQVGAQQSTNQQQGSYQQPTYQQSAFQQPSYQQPAYQQPAYQQSPYASAPQVIYTAAPEKKSHSWIIAVVAIVCLFAFTAFCVKTCTDSVSGAGMSGLSAGPATDSVAVINIDGTIQYDGTANSPEGLKELLDRAAENSKIKAVVLRVNSGGGVATAGEEMTTYLKQFDKPVVVSSASINASAAYELSSQADYIYVAKSTEIGAIGTAMQLTDLSGLLDMLGINMEVLTSADSKDSSYGYRPLTDEEREYYQHMIDQINGTFIQNVAEGRHMTVEQVTELATGLAFTGIDAVENGLADDFGTLEDAADKAASLAGISSYELYDLALVDYDLSSLYSLFGYSTDGEQKALPLLKQ